MEQARAELAELRVEAPHSMNGYSRSKFPHWIRQHEQCDTREVVLARDGRDVKQDAQCRAESGTWISPYDDKEFTAASQLDIDHIVPLANAWRSGADQWTTPSAANWPTTSPTPASGRLREQQPQQGRPEPRPVEAPSHAYWCTYARLGGREGRLPAECHRPGEDRARRDARHLLLTSRGDRPWARCPARGRRAAPGPTARVRQDRRTAATSRVGTVGGGRRHRHPRSPTWDNGAHRHDEHPHPLPVIALPGTFCDPAMFDRFGRRLGSVTTCGPCRG
ncbi:hypothetical protein NKH77_08380 [Streptomyces sp. M19]